MAEKGKKGRVATKKAALRLCDLGVSVERLYRPASVGCHNRLTISFAVINEAEARSPMYVKLTAAFSSLSSRGLTA